MCLAALVNFIVAVPSCSPAQRQSGRKCPSRDVSISTAYMFSAVNILVDWLFALLPVPLLWGSNLPLRVKISLIAVLGVGIIASSSRVAVLVSIVRSLTALDKLYAMCTTLIWAQVELGLAIIASSAATLRPLFRCIAKTASKKQSQKLEPSRPAHLKRYSSFAIRWPRMSTIGTSVDQAEAGDLESQRADSVEEGM